jgi:hypothetical protein
VGAEAVEAGKDVESVGSGHEVLPEYGSRFTGLDYFPCRS